LRVLLGFVDEVFPVDKADLLRAGEILRDPEAFSARDALHLAVMERYRISRILSFDEDFDRRPEITRIHFV